MFFLCKKNNIMAECPIKIGDKVVLKTSTLRMVVDSVNSNTWRCKCVFFDSEEKEFKFVELDYRTLMLVDNS